MADVTELIFKNIILINGVDFVTFFSKFRVLFILALHNYAVLVEF